MAELLTPYQKVRSPLLQKVGGKNKQILIVTIADQVAFDDTTVDAELRRLRNLVSGSQDVEIYKTYSEMRAEPRPRKKLIGMVVDASDGPDVKSGGASYVHDGTNWLYIGPLAAGIAQITWDDLQGKPLAEVRDIDEAADMRHDHDNKQVIDEFEETQDGKLHWKGKKIVGEDETIEATHFDTFPTPDQLKNLKVGGHFTVGDGPITGLVSAGGDTLDNDNLKLLADFQAQLTRLADRVTQVELDHIRDPDGVDPAVIGQAVQDYMAQNPVSVDMQQVNTAINQAITASDTGSVRSDGKGDIQIEITAS